MLKKNTPSPLHLLLFCLALLFSTTIQKAQAQTKNLLGSVTDENKGSLPGCTISLLAAKDSSLVASTSTDEQGKFALNNLPAGELILRVSFLGFKTQYSNLAANSSMVQPIEIILKSSDKLLKGVDVVSGYNPAKQRGDTTEFNANAYKTNRDANAEELLQKMPGVQMQDGKIQAQGEEVKKILVDGKPFMGDDPSAALRNIPAEMIDKVEVFDRKSNQSQFTGFDDGNTTKTLNIITKPSFKEGQFGKVYAGYGDQDHYKVGGNYNSFNKQRKITLLFQSNDINEQNFSSEDLLGVMNSSNNTPGRPQGMRGFGGGGSRSSFRPPSSEDKFLVDSRNGINQTHAGGFNYTGTLSKKADLSFSYFVNQTINNNESKIRREYLQAEDAGLIYEESGLARSTNTNHRVQATWEWRPDSSIKVEVLPKFSFQSNEGSSENLAFNTIGGKAIGGSNNNTGTKLSGYNGSVAVNVQKKLPKEGRTLSLSLTPQINQNDGQSNLNALVTNAGDSLAGNLIDQQTLLNKNGLGVNGSISYTEGIAKGQQLQLSYTGNFSTTASERNNFLDQSANDVYDYLDTALSSSFNNDYITHNASVSWKLQIKKMNLNAGLAVQQALLKSDQEFPVAFRIDKKFESILPTLSGQIRFTQTKNLRFMYRTSNNPPSVEQLQTVVNNTNPLQISSGNADLKQNYQHNAFMRYSATNPKTGGFFFAMMGGTYTQNYVANSTLIANADTLLNEDVFLQRGAQFLQPVNLNHYANIRSFVNYGFPLKFLKGNINVYGSLLYSNTPSLLNGLLNRADSKSYGTGIGYSSNISSNIDFSLNGNVNYTDVRNTLQSQLNSFFLTYNNKAKVQITLNNGLTFLTEINHQINQGLSGGFNQSFLLLNGALGYKFLKDKTADLRIVAFDLLKQNISVQRNINDFYLEDSSYNVLTRYFMLVFTYQIRNFKTGGEGENGVKKNK